MNKALSKIGVCHREQHPHLTPQHRCYYWGEYTPWAYTRGMNAEFSETNSLIASLKISTELRGSCEWESKLNAIDLTARAFASFWRWYELADKCVLITIPSSRKRDDPLYDDRMEQILDLIGIYSGTRLECLPLLESNGLLQASHIADNRPKLPQLVRSLSLNQQALPLTQPKMVFLFDDVLTTGAHFAASCSLLNRAFPQSKIIGNFVARTRRPDPQE